MTRRAALAVLLLAACTPAPTPPPPVEATDLGREGQWEVTAIDGRPIADAMPKTLLVGRTGGEGWSQCVRLNFNWPGMNRPLSRGFEITPVCERGRSADEERLQRLLVLADRFTFPAPGQLVASGPGGSVSLRRPAEPILNPQGWSETPTDLLWGQWRVAALDGKPPAQPMDFLAFQTRVELFSQCVIIARLIRFTSPGMTFAPDFDPTICERMQSPDEQRAGRILIGPIRVTEATARRRTLTTATGSISLER